MKKYQPDIVPNVSIERAGSVRFFLKRVLKTSSHQRDILELEPEIGRKQNSVWKF
jgi:hypothetical protein